MNENSFSNSNNSPSLKNNRKNGDMNETSPSDAPSCSESNEWKDMIADKSRLDWLLTNHVANFECVENIAGNLERYHIPATREAIDAEILRENATVNTSPPEKAL